MIDESEIEAAEAQLLATLDPAAADLSAAGIVKLLAAANYYGLTVKVHATLVQVPDEYYAWSNKEKRGEIKKLGSTEQWTFLTVTNLIDFAVTATWHGKTFDYALVGGERTGYRPAKFFGKNQQTKMIEEITKCLTD